MRIVRNPRIRPLKDFAAAVGATLKVEYTEPGQADYVLYDKSGERIASECDTYDMLDTLEAYYGGHPNYAHALADFQLATR